MSDPSTEQREREVQSLHRDIERDAEDLVEKSTFAHLIEQVSDRVSGLSKLTAELSSLGWSARGPPAHGSAVRA